ncbi:MAG: hypothetical protein IJQ75_03840 [Synergistaceae bacterium]|nr:hypothetical protein [Synergistaceae bacterium]MBQ7267688.1 hypothetical protein [Synergistaceae bacterium]MBR0279096.1 hypothetical protein [Synergistaceae bacterium]
MDAQVGNEIRSIMTELENDAPGVSEGLGTLVGATAGGAASLAALSSLGVAGLSAAGITSGLATAGALIGGGMAAGIGVLAAPIALLGIGGYALANRRKKSRMLSALNVAIEKLYSIQRRLQENAYRYREELGALTSLVEALKEKKRKI